MDSSAAVLDGLPNTIERQFDPFPDPLGRNIVDLNVWSIQEGLRGSTARELFDGFCQLLVAGGMQLLRGYVSTQTLHPQWSGYGYTWRRDLNSVYAQQFSRGATLQEWRNSPFYAVITRARAGEKTPWLRRRLELGPEQRDFPALGDFYAAGATDYLCVGYIFGEGGDPARWNWRSVHSAFCLAGVDPPPTRRASPDREGKTERQG